MFGLSGFLRHGSSTARTIAFVIGGLYNFTKTGSGQWTLTAANTYVGTTTVLTGTLTSTIGNSSASASGIGAATNPIVVASGATLEFTATAVRTTLMGNISGSGSVSQAMATSMGLHLGGDNSGFTGTYTRSISGAGTTFVADASGSENAAWVFNSGGVNGQTSFRYGATSEAWVTGLTSGVAHTLKFGSFVSEANCEIGNSTTAASQTANTTIEVGALGTDFTCAAPIKNTTTSSSAFTSSVLNIRKVGSGVWTLSGANTYTGTTAINGGGLYIAGSLAGTAITVSNTSGCRIGVGSAATKTATTSTLTMAGSLAAIDVHTNGTTVASRLNVTGAFAAGGCLVNVLGALNAGNYVIVSAGSSSGTLPVLGTNSSGRSVSFTLVAGVLTLVAV
jgi:fibronectin-binding autotransporter adhesin